MFKVRKMERKDTAPYVFAGLSLDPSKPVTLHTRALSLETREVFNGVFEAAEPQAQKPVDKFDERMVARARDINRLAKSCVPSWENVTELVEVEENGEEVQRERPLECTPENVLRFLQFLDRDVKDGGAGWREEITMYIQWAGTPSNFREELVSPDDVGKG